MFSLQTFVTGQEKQIIDLILTIQVKEFNVPVTAGDQPDLASIASVYQKGKGNFWVAMDNENVIGTIALIDIGDNMVALRKMFVHKDWRGKEKGVAQQLLNTAFAWCKEKDVRDIYLGTIERLHAARRFYIKNGFTEIPKTSLPSSFPVMAVDDYFYKFSFNASNTI